MDVVWLIVGIISIAGAIKLIWAVQTGIFGPWNRGETVPKRLELIVAYSVLIILLGLIVFWAVIGYETIQSIFF